MYIPATMRPSPGHTFVSAASGFALNWKMDPPVRPYYHMETVRGTASLHFRMETAGKHRVPLVGLYWPSPSGDTLAMPDGTHLIDSSIPIQYVVRKAAASSGRLWNQSLYRAVVSIRATTRLRTLWAQHHPDVLASFFVPVDRTLYLASLDPLLIWAYGPHVPA
jgi:hypothetical protein